MLHTRWLLLLGLGLLRWLPGQRLLLLQVLLQEQLPPDLHQQLAEHVGPAAIVAPAPKAVLGGALPKLKPRAAAAAAAATTIAAVAG